MQRAMPVVLFAFVASACSDSNRDDNPARADAAIADSALDGGVELDSGNDADGGTSDASSDADGSANAVDGVDLFERLAGLWSGPATRTRLGDFSMMNVDFRAPTDQFMFGRVDLDEEN